MLLEATNNSARMAQIGRALTPYWTKRLTVRLALYSSCEPRTRRSHRRAFLPLPEDLK